MEHQSIIVDSSFLVALYITDDSQHEIAEKIAKQMSGVKKIIVMHPYVIQEVTTILTYRIGIILAQRFLNDLFASKSVIIPQVNVLQEADFFKRMEKRMSFTDITLVHLAKQTDTPILSFDRQILALLKNL
ncbi:MAG: hypothetical protein UX81_C0005G0028 [Parcubacteria group bacterium GW2011_GWA2_47_12]|nr:MAG: hypothetical protein UX81_C0005G0028 [Parcubacteria group bacterium GW2011_GWA2_47_12]